MLRGMTTAADPTSARLHLNQAIDLVHHDRWMLGGLQDGKLRVLVDSSPETDRPYRRTRTLSHLARRCLHERKPLTVSALVAPDPDPTQAMDWEMNWPALLYAPVGMPRRRPTGLLVLGSQSEHWYCEDEIDYLAALGVSLTSTVLSLGGPVGRLRGRERWVAGLVSQGLSVSEIAVALGGDQAGAQQLVARALRKLSLRSPRQLVDAFPELEPSS